MLARVRAGFLHDRVGVSRSPAGVEDRRINIVHIERRLARQHEEAAQRAACAWLASETDGGDEAARAGHARASAVLRVGKAREDARERLIPAWMARQYPDLADAIAEDAAELARMVVKATATADGASSVSARLEALATQPCPKFHADTVGARGLVTYSGGERGGTQYLPNSRVKRGWASDGAPFVAGVKEGEDEGGAAPLFEAAALGDLLLLKGHDCPGMLGCMGAVHRSPPIQQQEPRLVLTVDDALPAACDCCPPDDNDDDVAKRREEAMR